MLKKQDSRANLLEKFVRFGIFLYLCGRFCRNYIYRSKNQYSFDVEGANFLIFHY